MIRVPDPVLRAQLVADIRARAQAWRDQGTTEPTVFDARHCELFVAKVLEQLARDLEQGA